MIDKILAAGGIPYLVGGSVRDLLLGLQSKDQDIEVHNLEPEVLRQILGVSPVGESFEVYKVGGVDYSLPRTERCIGSLHTSFEINVDPHMGIEAALKRRDFTINSMAVPIRESGPVLSEIIDPFGGREDLKNRVLRHTSPAFSEDPLRVLRGARFCGRLGLTPHPYTVSLCNSLSPESLSKERIYQELSQVIRYSGGLRFLEKTWLHHFPILHNMVGIPQDPEWHPEGDVWEHTLHVVDSMRAENDVEAWAAVLHDCGKPQTTIINKKGRWSSPGHAEVGAKLADPFLQEMKAPYSVIKGVCTLIERHMDYINPSSRMARRLLLQYKPNFSVLFKLMRADKAGRPPLKPNYISIDLLQQIIEVERVVHNQYFVNGDDLIAVGYKSGIELGERLRFLHEMQIRHGWSKERLMRC